DVTFTFTGDGSLEGLQGEAIISDPSVFSNIDATNLCSGASAVVVSCILNGAGDRLLVTAANGPGTPLESFTGTATFTIDGAATPGTIVDLTWDTADPDFTPVVSTDGSIEVIDTPPEEISELAASPASIGFGTVDLGGMPVTDMITAENVGGSSSSLTISAVNYSGDAAFSVTGDGCTGTTLAFGETCGVTVQFDAGSNGTFNGSVAFTSDADTNPTPSVAVSGTADSAPNLSVSPAFGPVSLGEGFPGDTLSANGSLSNSGSAAGTFDCTLNDATGVFSTNPSPLAGSVPAGGSVDFSLSCALPGDAEDGDTYSASLVCSGDISGTHDLSCGVSEFEPLPVPTMQKWGLIVLTLMMLVVGGISIRFFRA
ncbi:MAG: choice-of-anchor D domain-containing protein, partial [Gammaproteobacteria bacterium]|nr:choice-of-anchor D domain-containing protein [Gammaproteobacteria bacterium]